MLTERRLAARARKLASLETEFTRWEQESADGRPLRLHHSQIGRITGVLRLLHAQVTKKPEAPGGAAAARALTDREIETTALELHRIWEFFRAKFAMRKVDWLRPYLDAVDDFAWACYKPARDTARNAGRIAATALREPPLLFFGGGWSPFAMPRNYPFEAEMVPGEPVRNKAFVETLKKLPVPVVGIPWFQVEHLPDAVVIGHEVGHIVDDDLQLSATIQDVVGGAADPARRPAWRAWAGEIFGDFWGQLATGPAFVGGLAEVLADEPDWVVKQVANAPWSEYPTTYLRMNLNFELLRALQFTAAADALHAEWTGAYGPAHKMAAYDADTKAIAQALVGTPFAEFGGRTLPQVLSFVGLQEECDIAIGRLAANAKPDPGDVRALIAAARLFFASSPGKYDGEAQGRVLDAIKASLPPGVRGSRAVTSQQSEADALLSTELINLLAGR